MWTVALGGTLPHMSGTSTPTEASLAAPAWPRWLLRLTSTVSVIALVNQAAIANDVLWGSYGSLALHRDNAMVCAVSLVLTLLSAILVRRRGGGPTLPVVMAASLCVLAAVQILAGFERWLTVHLPIGITLPVLAAGLSVWSWRRRSQTD